MALEMNIKALEMKQIRKKYGQLLNNYYGTLGIFDLAKNPNGKDIHHEVMKFLEESSIYLLCHVTSEEFNQMLKDSHPERHDPCKDAIIDKKIPFEY